VKRVKGESKQHFSHRLYRTRTYGVWNGQKTQAKKLDVPFTLTLETLREMVTAAVGKPCPYCQEVLTLRTFSADHKTPASAGGSFDADNFEIICQRDNETKGRMLAHEYAILISTLKIFSEASRADVLRRLRMGSAAMRNIFWGGKRQPGKPAPEVASAVKA
jgi:5-methylcytosine-specific restriction endonuclease McrA